MFTIKSVRPTGFAVLMLAALGVVTGDQTATAGESRHVNFAVFEKVNPGFQYEAYLVGKFSDFIKAMDGAQVLLISHTANAVNGDVINIQQDVLRENSGQLDDNGINCQLSFVDKSKDDNPDYSIGGLCKIIQVDNNANDVRLNAVISPTSIPDTAQGVDAWIKLSEDKKTGIAFYANVSH